MKRKTAKKHPVAKPKSTAFTPIAELNEGDKVKLVFDKTTAWAKEFEHGLPGKDDTYLVTCVDYEDAYDEDYRYQVDLMGVENKIGFYANDKDFKVIKVEDAPSVEASAALTIDDPYILGYIQAMADFLGKDPKELLAEALKLFVESHK